MPLFVIVRMNRSVSPSPLTLFLWGCRCCRRGERKDRKEKKILQTTVIGEHTKITLNTLVSVLLFKKITTKHQDLKYEVVNKQKRGFEGRRLAPHPSGDTA